MIIKYLTEDVVDVFTGNGWDNWSRFKLGMNTPKKVAGNNLTEKEYADLKQQLYPSRKK